MGGGAECLSCKRKSAELVECVRDALRRSRVDDDVIDIAVDHILNRERAVLVALALIMFFGEYSLGSIMLSSSTILIFSMLVTALTAPLSFKFGTTKGKVIYGAVLGAMLAISTAILGIMDAWGFWIGTNTLLMAVGTAIIIYLLSWLLSVRFYKKRQF